MHQSYRQGNAGRFSPTTLFKYLTHGRLFLSLPTSFFIVQFSPPLYFPFAFS